MKHEHGIEQAEQDVFDFMREGGQACPDHPFFPSQDVRELRVRLIAEELVELADAYHVKLTVDTDAIAAVTVAPRISNVSPSMGRIVEAYDAVLDLVYVVIGTGIAQGTSLARGWMEVQRSNMAKFGPGSSKRADGKVQKPPDWKRPELEPIVAAQMPLESSGTPAI